MDVTGAGRIIRHTAADRKSRDCVADFSGTGTLRYFQSRCDRTQSIRLSWTFFGKDQDSFSCQDNRSHPQDPDPMDEETVQGFYGEEEDNENAARAGTDSQEIFDTRYYHQGDMLKNIHCEAQCQGEI